MNSYKHAYVYNIKLNTLLYSTTTYKSNLKHLSRYMPGSHVLHLIKEKQLPNNGHTVDQKLPLTESMLL